MQCPYCVDRNADSRDHVFPDFLGGKARVPACTHCNSTLGHTIEAGALAHLKNLMLFLRRSGMPTPKPMVWKGIALGPSGERYDIDQDFNVIPSRPAIERDATGRITAARGSRRQILQIQRSLERDGRAFRLGLPEPVKFDMQQLHIGYPIDNDTKRLCIKMSVAASLVTGKSVSLDARARSYLLEAIVRDVCPVRIAIDEYNELDQRRPPVGHLVYVRASSAERRVYAIVQFYSAIQFYCELAVDYKEGPDWATLATHDPVTHEESFGDMPLLDYPLPLRHVPANTLQKRFHERLERLRLELVGLYGDQAPLSLHLNE